MSVGGILTMRKAMIDERPVEEIAVPAGIVAGVSFFATVAMGSFRCSSSGEAALFGQLCDAVALGVRTHDLGKRGELNGRGDRMVGTVRI